MKPFVKLACIPLIAALTLTGAADNAGELRKLENLSAKRAVQAAIEAGEAAERAREAVKEAQAAAGEAGEFAKQAKEASYQAYLASMALRRALRVESLPAPPEPPETAFETNNPIDRFVMARWPEGTEPELCSDTAFLRRVFLDVTGMIPSATEVAAFLEDERPDKRARWIDELLERDRAYATHWVQWWEDALCSNGKHQGGVGTRGNFRDFILESFMENKPYDVFTAQLIDPGAVNYHGGFVRSQTHQDSLLTAANAGQVFLGTKMKCASCHDDFLNFEWTQKRFFGFASFFSENDLEIIRCEEKQGEYAEAAFVFDNQTADPDQLDTLEERLGQVTDFLVDPANPRYAASFVNRLWKRYTGVGIVEPVDDFRIDVPPSHPELLQWMSHEFAANGYDIKHMVRLILNSRVYQQKFDQELVDEVAEGRNAERYFRSPAMRRLTCEQFLDSAALALGELKTRVSFDETTTALTLALGRPATRNEVRTLRPEDVATIQALEFINGPDLHNLIKNSSLPERLETMAPAEEAVDYVYRALYSRPPSADELEFTLEFFGPEIVEEEWADIVWALVVSPEFQYIH